MRYPLPIESLGDAGDDNVDAKGRGDSCGTVPDLGELAREAAFCHIS